MNMDDVKRAVEKVKITLPSMGSRIEVLLRSFSGSGITEQYLMRDFQVLKESFPVLLSLATEVLNSEVPEKIVIGKFDERVPLAYNGYAQALFIEGHNFAIDQMRLSAAKKPTEGK